MKLEIHVGPATAFRSADIEIAKLFLAALGDRQVKLESVEATVITGADIALQILERATPKMA
jgi:hypothetical protein